MHYSERYIREQADRQHPDYEDLVMSINVQLKRGDTAFDPKNPGRKVFVAFTGIAYCVDRNTNELVFSTTQSRRAPAPEGRRD